MTLTSRDSLRERGARSAERGKRSVAGRSLAGDKSNGVGIRFGLFDGVEGLTMTDTIGWSETTCLAVSLFGVWVVDESLSSVDLASSASRDACRASNCAPGCGVRGRRGLRMDRPEDLLEGDFCCDVSTSLGPADEPSFEI